MAITGQKQGKKAIESFFQEQGIEGAAVTYEKRDCKACVSNYRRNGNVFGLKQEITYLQ